VIGGSVTSIAMVRKRGKTLDTVIKGVEVASETFDEMKSQLLTSLKVLIKEEDYKKVEEMLTKATSIKEIIKKIADVVGTESYLHTRVRLFCGEYYYLTLREAYEKFKTIYENEESGCVHR